MNTCPCCSEPLLRHVRYGGVYWFCSHCWQEMPDLPEAMVSQHQCYVPFKHWLQGVTVAT